MKIARILSDLATRIAPADARMWIEGIKAEIAYAPPAEALSFAAGAMVTAVRLRMAHPPLVHGAARYGLAAAALVWAGLQLRLALQLNTIDPSLPAVLTFVTALVFGLGGLVTALAGLRFTLLLGVPMLAMVTLYAAGAHALLPQSPNLAFYRALALEDAAALLTAVVLAALARRYAGGRRSHAL